ncbi:SDR family oxidoreductase [Streptomyces sp. NPDC051183]|uniref:SDR family NAD(P)-dependent oxidoreductase n=1 Tax=unclassified Streptomyces TaxID=2593676 RepID=UPI0034441512
MRRFDGYSVVVTGAARGIGARIAEQFVAEGARVLIADKDEQHAAQTAERTGALSLECDVTSDESVREAIIHAVTEFGRLDVLVNNAAHASPTQPAGQSDEVWLRDLDTTLLGAVRCARAAMPHLIASGRGAIVNIGSVNGEHFLGAPAYSAAKAGLASLTRSLAGEYAHRGVRCNLIAAGTVRTPYWDSRKPDLDMVAAHYPLGRIGEPADIAAACLFLASTEASWTTGATLPVDGGLLIANLGILHALGFDPN